MDERKIKKPRLKTVISVVYELNLNYLRNYHRKRLEVRERDEEESQLHQE